MLVSIFLNLTVQELDRVLVVVTRYFGGTHLGPDRWVFLAQGPIYFFSTSFR